MATPEYKIHGIPVRAAPDDSLQEGQSPCKCCALYDCSDYTDCCTPRAQNAAGFEHCLGGHHHYVVMQ